MRGLIKVLIFPIRILMYILITVYTLFVAPILFVLFLITTILMYSVIGDDFDMWDLPKIPLYHIAILYDEITKTNKGWKWLNDGTKLF